MGRKSQKPRLIPEQNRRICGGICVCQFTMVMSCVALVYLTVAIYMPSHRAFRSGIDPTPVACQTTSTVMANNCQWASCGEWCLTKTSGFCPQINVTVRRNGTDLLLVGCEGTTRTLCPPVVEEHLPRHNCNNGSECELLTGLFRCKHGHCANLSTALQCPVRADGQVVNSERDNVKLNGVFECTRGTCTKVKHEVVCDRYCHDIETTGVNVMVVHGDSVLTAHCERAESLHEANGTAPGRAVNNTEFWPALPPPWAEEDEEAYGGGPGEQNVEGAAPSSSASPAPTPTPTPARALTPAPGEATVLLVACRDASFEGDTISGSDCVNGSLLGASALPHPRLNFTVLSALYARAQAAPADPHGRYAPPQHLLTIYNQSRLYINLEACVNTLQDECKSFLRTHGPDGRNRTAQAQFPCFFDPANGFFVVARFDLEKTLRELVVAAAVPAALFFVSWVSLCVITRSVNVGDDARMRCKYCGGGSGDAEERALAPPPTPPPPRRHSPPPPPFDAACSSGVPRGRSVDEDDEAGLVVGPAGRSPRLAGNVNEALSVSA